MTDKILELAVSVARMEGKLDTLVDSFPAMVKKRDEEHTDHENRIKSMERKWNIASGIGVAFTTIGAILSYLYDFFHIFPHKG